MDVMLKSGSRHIEQDLNQILENHGYQNEERGDNYIDIGVNWGLHRGRGFQMRQTPQLLPAIVAVALLIIFTGYLIIYNVFQISVAGDIRFYGLFKNDRHYAQTAAADYPSPGPGPQYCRYPNRPGAGLVLWEGS